MMAACDRAGEHRRALVTARCATMLLHTIALTACPAAQQGVHDDTSVPPSPQLEDDGDRGPDRDSGCPTHVPYTASVRARVVDEHGAGLPDARVQLCIWTNDGRMLCLEPGRADAAGDVLIDVAEAARCMVSATARVLLPQSRRPALYCAVELAIDDASVTVTDPYLLLEAAAPSELPPLDDEAGARTVAFDGLALEVTPAAIGAEAYQRLAAAVLAPEQVPACMAAAAPAFDLLVAFSPEGDVAGAGFPLALDNTLALEPGARIELFVQGGLACTLGDGTLVEKAAWRSLGDAVVSADGARIEARGSAAVPCLGWLGLRR